MASATILPEKKQLEEAMGTEDFIEDVDENLSEEEKNRIVSAFLPSVYSHHRVLCFINLAASWPEY